MKTIILLITGLFFFLMAGSIEAAVFPVTTSTEFQNALNTAASNGEGDTIQVAAGTYTPSATFNYNPVATENFPISIVGAGPGVTILSGANIRRVLRVNLEGLTSDTNAHINISGLTIQNGKVTGYEEGGGAHLWANYANVTVNNCEFKNNAGQYYGGGLYARSTRGPVTITDSVFTGNTSPYTPSNGRGGGGYFVSWWGSVTVIRSYFANNSAGNHGGFFAFCDSGPLTITENKMLTNTVTNAGGGAGLETSGGTMKVFNNIVSGNQATSNLVGGAGLLLTVDGGQTYFYNNTLTGNTSAGTGGGILLFFYSVSTLNLYNNIIWGNTATGDGDDIYAKYDLTSGTVTVNLYNSDYSQFQSTARVTLNQANNINQNPNLTSDFKLQHGSPCVDQGNNSPPGTPLPATDFEGQKRIADGDGIGTAVVDMGADELPENPTLVDFDGDAKTDIAVYHSPSGIWFIKKSSDGTSYYVGYGGTDYKPVPGDYDGDGKTDIAVYHSPSGLWFIKKSSDGTSYYVGYGGTEYHPVNLPYLMGWVY